MVDSPVPISDIDEVFDVVYPYVDMVKMKADGLSAEEVLRRLKAGEATLHTVGVVGFFVAVWTDDNCHILCAASFKDEAIGIEMVINAVGEYAKINGKSTMTFTSPRLGWLKVSKRVNAVVKRIDYEVSL